MTTWAVLLDGELTPTPRLSELVKGTRVIAADGGMRHAAALGVEPELWIGDFDSSDKALMAAWPDVPRHEHPPAKDMTDGHLAVEHALRQGARRVLLVAALGGRSDHALTHLTQLIDLAGRGVTAMATSGSEEAWPLLAGESRISLPAGTQFSLIGLTPLKKVSMSGARWSLDDADLPLGSSRPLSNVAHGEVRISIGEGRAILLARFP